MKQHVGLLTWTKAPEKPATSLGARRVGARLHPAPIDESDRRIEDHLIPRLDAAIHFDPRAEIALHFQLAQLRPAVVDDGDLHSVAVEDGNAMSVAFATERNSAMKRSDLADLNAFVVVANHLSFRAASTQLGVTASALSHSMRQLEERHGVRLLHRTTRSVSLTDAGLRCSSGCGPPSIRFPALWRR
jgi:Bacterial regulatory helix-turn-helix protein, lysR family